MSPHSLHSKARVCIMNDKMKVIIHHNGLARLC
jgi:hypothetical protein